MLLRPALILCLSVSSLSLSLSHSFVSLSLSLSLSLTPPHPSKTFWSWWNRRKYDPVFQQKLSVKSLLRMTAGSGTERRGNTSIAGETTNFTHTRIFSWQPDEKSCEGETLVGYHSFVLCLTNRGMCVVTCRTETHRRARGSWW